jgi:hypothetical protein
MLFQHIPKGKLKKAVYLNTGIGAQAWPRDLHIGAYSRIPVKFILSQIFHFIYLPDNLITDKLTQVYTYLPAF